MEINACVENKEPSFYLKNCSPVALLFKDGGSLANHPLSCHPQGVFGNQENERKAKKMKQKKKSGKTPAQQLFIQQRKNQDPFTRFHLSLYSAQLRKNKKIPSIPIIHEGKNRKNHKKEVKREANEAKKKQENAEEFRTMQKFHTLLRSCFIFQLFLLFFSYGF